MSNNEKEYIDDETGIHMIVSQDKHLFFFTRLCDIDETREGITRLEEMAAQQQGGEQ